MAKHLLISGRVQGVGFRESMTREAKRLGVSGWVRNLRDGRVEAVADGPAAEALIAWARSGPPAAEVTELRIAEVNGQLTGFIRLPTA